MKDERIKSLGLWALYLSFIAITAVEFSYVLGGSNWLDPLVFLLIPAFILLIIQLILTCKVGSINYCVAFTILIVCIIFSLFYRLNFEVATHGDAYHILKIVALSIKNNFFTQFPYQMKMHHVYFISDFVESIWGIFWRWTRWDFIIVFLQALPIILLWQQLVRFFQIQKVVAFPGPLATIVIMSMEVLWSQQGTTFTDSTVGIFIGINLLLCYNFLSPPYERRFSYLAGLMFISGLCLISKPIGIYAGILGLTIAFVLGCRHLNTFEKFVLPQFALPSLIYFFYYQIQIQLRKGSFIYHYYNFLDENNTWDFFYGYHYLYTPLMFFSWIRDHAFNFKPLYVLSSWLADYKLDLNISPSPNVRGNGLVFSYLVVPTLILWIFQHKNIFKKEIWKDPRISILGVIFVYYYFFDGSISARYALGYNIFILSWCLSYLWQNLELCHLKWLKPFSTIMVCFLLLMSFGNYRAGVRGNWLQMHILSPLVIQKEIYPNPYSPEMRTKLILKYYPQYIENSL